MHIGEQQAPPSDTRILSCVALIAVYRVSLGILISHHVESRIHALQTRRDQSCKKGKNSDKETNLSLSKVSDKRCHKMQIEQLMKAMEEKRTCGLKSDAIEMSKGTSAQSKNGR